MDTCHPTAARKANGKAVSREDIAALMESVKAPNPIQMLLLLNTVVENLEIVEKYFDQSSFIKKKYLSCQGPTITYLNQGIQNLVTITPDKVRENLAKVREGDADAAEAP